MRKLMWFTLGFGAACAWGAYFANQYAAVLLIAALLIASFAAYFSRVRKKLRAVVLLFVGIAMGIGWFWAFSEARLALPRYL